jgi:hypothetical protein
MLTSYGGNNNNLLVTAPSSTPANITQTASTIVSANSNRNSLTLQNVGTKSVFIRLGGTASVNDYNFILAGGTGVKTGDGGSIIITGKEWTGYISALCDDPMGSIIAILEL